MEDKSKPDKALTAWLDHLDAKSTPLAGVFQRPKIQSDKFISWLDGLEKKLNPPPKPTETPPEIPPDQKSEYLRQREEFVKRWKKNDDADEGGRERSRDGFRRSSRECCGFPDSFSCPQRDEKMCWRQRERRYERDYGRGR